MARDFDGQRLDTDKIVPLTAWRDPICLACGFYESRCICHTLCPHKNLWGDCDECEPDPESVAQAIYDDQCAELDALESSMGIEPRGWEDSY